MRRRSAAGVSLLAALLVALISMAVAHAQSVETISDRFLSISFQGSTGSRPWSGPWGESGEADGPASGVVRVAAGDRCAGGTGNCLQLGGDGVSLEDRSLARSLDLDGALSASLSFHYRRETSGSTAGDVAVQVSRNGGVTWGTLTTLSLTGPQRAFTADFDITAYATDDTMIRFEGSGSGVTGFLHIDDVSVIAEYPDSTTTTLPASTTTTVPSTTSTTGPSGPSTTSTTDPSETSTTTSSSVPGSTDGTTTTVPDTTTTLGAHGGSSADDGDGEDTVTTVGAESDPETEAGGTPSTPGTSRPNDESSVVAAPPVESLPADPEAAPATVRGNESLASIALDAARASAPGTAAIALMAVGFSLVGFGRSD